MYFERLMILRPIYLFIRFTHLKTIKLLLWMFNWAIIKLQSKYLTYWTNKAPSTKTLNSQIPALSAMYTSFRPSFSPMPSRVFKFDHRTHNKLRIPNRNRSCLLRWLGSIFLFFCFRNCR
jgi:hypothetical protein